MFIRLLADAGLLQFDDQLKVYIKLEILYFLSVNKLHKPERNDG